MRTATGGRVVVRVIGAAQDDEATMISNMRIGRQHAASITAVGLASVDSVFNIFTIPMFFATYDEYRAVRAKMEPTIKQKLEAKGLVLLNWGDTGWVYLFSKNPTPNVDELRKQRLYTSAGDDQFVQLYKAERLQPAAAAVLGGAERADDRAARRRAVDAAGHARLPVVPQRAAHARRRRRPAGRRHRGRRQDLGHDLRSRSHPGAGGGQEDPGWPRDATCRRRTTRPRPRWSSAA